MEERFSATDIIKQILEVEGLNQTDVSVAVFKQKNRLSQAFANGTDMSVSNFAAVCDAMGYDVQVVRRERRIPEHFSLDTTPKRRHHFKG